MRRSYPFSGGDVFSTFDSHLKQVLAEIDQLDNAYMLKASPTELEEHFVDKAKIEPLSLGEPHIEGQRGVQIDVSGDFNRVMFRGENVHVTGTQVDIAIPYQGEQSLWHIRPSRFSVSGYPELDFRDDRVVFSVQFPDDSPNSARLKTEIERQLTTLSKTVENQRADVERYMASMPQTVKQRLAEKRQKAEAAIGAVASLGLPMKRRDQPATYAVPTKRRASPIQRPSVSAEKYTPEPVLAMAEYQHILSVLRSMSLVIERNPDSFKGLNEETIRGHFLLQLNGHYEGSATGETFNHTGKTDILIRVGDRNVFIAECKFWSGAKAFNGAIDQLLGYLTWRDCKCALLVFNRTKDSAGVRTKMHDVMAGRAEHRKTIQAGSDGDAQYVYVKATEPGREIIITSQVFDISPTP